MEYVNSTKFDKDKDQILELLIEGLLTKKEIANKLKVDPGFVFKIYDQNKALITKEKNKRELVSASNNVIKQPIMSEAKATMKKRLSQDQKLNVGIDIENGMAAIDVAKKYGVSLSRIYQIKGELGLTHKQNKAPVKKKVIEKPKKNSISTVIETDQSLILSMKKENVNILPVAMPKMLRCGLVADRHDMPIKKYIYENNTATNLMFDFNALYKIAIDFIKANIKFDTDGKPDRGMILYATGLQTPMVAALKAITDLGVSCQVAHYEASLKKYMLQLFSGSPEEYSSIYTLFDKITDVYSYDSHIEDYKNIDNFYIVKINEYQDHDGISTMLSSRGILVKDYDSVWKVYPALNKIIMHDTKHHYGIFVDPVTRNGNNYKEELGITKNFNFRTNF